MAYEAQKKYIKNNKEMVLNTRYIRQAIILAKKYNIKLSKETINYFKKSLLGKELKFLISATQKKKYQGLLSYLPLLSQENLMDAPDTRIAIHRYLYQLKQLKGVKL